MRSRGLVVAIAVVLAVAAAAAVILYTQGVKEEAVRGWRASQTVIVSIAGDPGERAADPLVDQDIFKQIQVPQDALVAGAVTDIAAARGCDDDHDDLRERADPDLSPLDRTPAERARHQRGSHRASRSSSMLPRAAPATSSPATTSRSSPRTRTCRRSRGTSRQLVNNPAAAGPARAARSISRTSP